MDNIKYSLELLKSVDRLYNDVLLGNKDILDKLDELMVQILKYDDLTGYDEKQIDLITLVIKSFTDKVNLIYKLLDMNVESELNLEELEKEFNNLEIKRFETVNRYIMGIIVVEDIEDFKKCLFSFRDRLYAIQINDSNILKIARMKSKVQHFDTEILEDEEILKVAYANSN